MNKICVVTGGSKGIGKSLVMKYAENGFDVVVCARTMADLEKLKAEVELSTGSNIRLCTCDMSVKAEVIRFAQFVNDLGSVEVLINNAGVFIPGEVKNEEEGSLELMINTNLYSAYHLTRALLPKMIQAEKGHIFNMCSVASLKAYPNGGSYSISKFAMYGMGKVLREELKETGLRVTNVMPGATLTASWDGVELPEERFMKPDDVAESIWSAYTLSDRTVIEDLVLRPQLGDI